MNDIVSRADIDVLIHSFYEKAMTDELIGHFFTEVVSLDLKAHLPHIADFWETTLLHNPTYKGNPIPPHQAMHKKSPLKKEHFDRWVSLFSETVQELFQGPKATMAVQRAQSIATVMQIKIHA